VHHATPFNAMKAFAVLAVMLVCSVGLYTSHQAGALAPAVRRQLVSGAAQGSAAGAGLSCPTGSYYGGVNGCRGCGVGLTTRGPGALKLEDCGELLLLTMPQFRVPCWTPKGILVLHHCS
jgi:hypothetical protein